MQAPFGKTLASLDLEQRRARPLLLLTVTGVALLSWVAWATWAHLRVYVVSQHARIEQREVRTLVAPVAGRVKWTHVELGRPIEIGEVLAELESSVEQQRLSEASERRASYEPQLAALERQVSHERQQLTFEQGVTRSAIAAARARLNEATADANFAETEAERVERLGQGVAEIERMRLRAEAVRKRAAAAAITKQLEKTPSERAAVESAAQVRIDELEQEIGRISGALRAAGATQLIAQEQLERYRVRSNVAGRIVATAGLSPGAHVREGESLGTLLPDTELRIVAEVRTDQAVGRIEAGQAARMRFHGFPWIEYGMARATVAHVASEPQHDVVRVELLIDREQSARIPLQHGLEGDVEIEIERVSPLRLMLRLVGARIDSRIDASNGAR